MHRIDFNELDWQSPLPKLRAKVHEQDGRRLRLVVFEPGFVEPDWCRRGHIGYVVSGEADIEFPDHTERFRPGDGLFIPADTPHLLTVPGDAVTLVLVDDAT